MNSENVSDYGSVEFDYYNYRKEAYDQIPKLVFVLGYSGISVIGILGNSVVILVVARYRRIRSPTYIIIASLAVADLVFVLFCVPLMAVQHLRHSDFPIGGNICKLRQYVGYCSLTVSAYHLVLLAGVRYIILMYPMWSRRFMSIRNTIKVCVILWLTICLAFSPTAVFYQQQDFVEGNNQTVTSCWFTGDITIFDTSITVVSFILPLLLTITIHVLKYWKVNATINSQMNLKQMGRREKFSVSTVVTVILVFLFCWGPFHVITFILNYTNLIPNTEVFLKAIIPTQCLAYGNSCLNPIIYAFLAPSFRKGVIKLLGRTCMKPIKPEGLLGLTMSGMDESSMIVNNHVTSEGKHYQIYDTIALKE